MRAFIIDVLSVPVSLSMVFVFIMYDHMTEIRTSPCYTAKHPDLTLYKALVCGVFYYIIRIRRGGISNTNIHLYLASKSILQVNSYFYNCYESDSA